MDDFIKIVKSLKNSVVLIDGVIELLKQEIIKNRLDFGGGNALLAPLACSMVQPVIFSVFNGITGRGVIRTGRGCYNNMDKNF